MGDIFGHVDPHYHQQDTRLHIISAAE